MKLHRPRLRWERLSRLRAARRPGAREQRGEHAPDLWPVWAAAPIVLVLGCAVAVGVFRWLDARAIPVAVPGGRPRVDTLDVLKTTVAVLAFVGALLGALYAYRKQRLAEGDASRADAEQFADRYSKALDQLGSEQAAIRLGGVYGMARLADDWNTQRQTCVDVLCAYLRMPYEPVGTPQHRPGEDEVRKTIVRVIAEHLRPGSTSCSWSTQRLDFSGAYLEEANFMGATFSDATQFARATFSISASFTDATFRGEASFGAATFLGGVSFAKATFTDTAFFSRTTFSISAGFENARFLDLAFFDEATFSGSWFVGARFSSLASFKGCTFPSGYPGSLARAHFDGPLDPGPFELPADYTHFQWHPDGQ